MKAYKDIKLIIKFSKWNESLRAIHLLYLYTFFYLYTFLDTFVKKSINFRKYSQFYIFEN